MNFPYTRADGSGGRSNDFSAPPRNYAVVLVDPGPLYIINFNKATFIIVNSVISLHKNKNKPSELEGYFILLIFLHFSSLLYLSSISSLSLIHLLHTYPGIIILQYGIKRLTFLFCSKRRITRTHPDPVSTHPLLIALIILCNDRD